jgi:hypothetical protein
MVNILLQWITTGLIALLHPFFVSVIEINHNAKDATVEISVRIFAEDLEKTLRKYTPGKIDVTAPADKAFIDKQIGSYVSQKLHLKVNGQPVSFTYLGYEIQQESAWCYFEAAKVTDMKKLEVDCSLLYDYEKSQTNIFHVKSRGVEKSWKLDYPQNTAVFDF